MFLRTIPQQYLTGEPVNLTQSLDLSFVILIGFTNSNNHEHFYISLRIIGGYERPFYCFGTV